MKGSGLFVDVPPNTEANAEELADEKINQMSIEDLKREVKHHLLIEYEHDDLSYRHDWLETFDNL